MMFIHYCFSFSTVQAIGCCLFIIVSPSVLFWRLDAVYSLLFLLQYCFGDWMLFIHYCFSFSTVLAIGCCLFIIVSPSVLFWRLDAVYSLLFLLQNCFGYWMIFIHYCFSFRTVREFGCYLFIQLLFFLQYCSGDKMLFIHIVIVSPLVLMAKLFKQRDLHTIEHRFIQHPFCTAGCGDRVFYRKRKIVCAVGL